MFQKTKTGFYNANPKCSKHNAELYYNRAPLFRTIESAAWQRG